MYRIVITRYFYEGSCLGRPDDVFYVPKDETFSHETNLVDDARIFDTVEDAFGYIVSKESEVYYLAHGEASRPSYEIEEV